MAGRGRTQVPQDVSVDMAIIRRVLKLVWSHRFKASLAVLLLVAAKVATVGVPLLLKLLVDALDGGPQAALALPVGLLVGYGGLRLSGTVLKELRTAVFARVHYGIMRQTASRVVGHLHGLSLGFHLERRTGALTRDIDRGTRSVSTLVNYLLFQIAPTLLEVAMVATILMVSYSVWFALVAVVTVTIYVAFTLLMTSWRIRFRAEMNAAESEASQAAIDGLLNYETVKFFGNEGLELSRYDERLETWEVAAVKSQHSLSLLNMGQGAIIAGGVTAVMWLAADGVASGEMTLGDFVAVNAFLLQLFAPLGFLGTIYSVVKHALADMARMFELLDRPSTVQDAPGAPALAVSEGEVRFEGVRFGYASDREILKGVSFVVPAGKKVAVVGPSGAGKSTLGRLLCRFYDVDGGRIEVDGQDTRGVTQASLRAAIGVVPQDAVLFNESIGYNLRYARPDASWDEVKAAAAAAQLHDFIEGLPQGYETRVGERGLKLSGGEKQRMAIARVILKAPPILLFDEATSSLDSSSEAAILEALEAVSRQHTTLVIAHRLSTIVNADEILVMDAGQIVERGSHVALLSQGGVYARMWALQQDGDARANALGEAAA